jgi:hypothetical protein
MLSLYQQEATQSLRPVTEQENPILMVAVSLLKTLECPLMTLAE